MKPFFYEKKKSRSIYGVLNLTIIVTSNPDPIKIWGFCEKINNLGDIPVILV